MFMSYEPFEVDRASFKHTGFGIASFIITLMVGFLAFALMAVAGFLDATTPGGLDEDSPAAMFIGLGLFALVFVDVVGLFLGFAGLFQARRNKTFAALGLGLAIGSLTLIGFAMWMAFGTIMD